MRLEGIKKKIHNSEKKAGGRAGGWVKCGVTAFGVVQTCHVESESVESVERSHRLTNSKPREVRRTHLLVRDQREGVRSHGPLRLVVHVVLEHVVRFDLLHRRFAQLAPHVLRVEDQSGPPGVSWRSGVSGVSQLAGMGRRSREERRCGAVRCGAMRTGRRSHIDPPNHQC